MGARKSLWVTLWSLVVIGGLVGCEPKHSKPNVQPPKDIKRSFAVQSAKASGLAVDGYLIGIQKESLEKEFLLRSQMVTQTLAPMFQGLRGRIVAFRQRGDEILMLEATEGHMIDNTTPAELVVAKFKIVKEADGILYFDLNEGLSELYTAADWRGSDFEGQMYSEARMFKTLPLVQSYIQSARFDAANQLVVTQVGQMKVTQDWPQANSVINVPVKTMFFLSTYKPDPDFKPFATRGDFSQFGFFEVAPIITRSTYPESFATKFNHQKPIVYAVSANTPAEIREVVREGILYWNKAFGREVIQVVDAPESARAPDTEFNIVQWVNWDWAGFAYADAQMDPRTGQIMNSQVFMTSAFAVLSRAAARRAVKQIATASARPDVRLGLKGFTHSTMCDLSHTREFAARLTALLADPTVTDEKIARASKDLIRVIIAHEVGHTMGLRHNFAGSTHANYGPYRREELIKEYFENGKVDPSVIPTSSVMEYSHFLDMVLAGHQMKRSSSAFKYDELAIRKLYDGAEFSRRETPAFCTDSHIRQTLDCMVWDIGPSYVEAAVYNTADLVRTMPEALMDAFVYAKSPDPISPQVPVERVPLDADLIATRIADLRVSTLKILEKDARLLTLERQFDVVDAVNADEVRAKRLDDAKKEFDRLGGMKKALSSWPEADLHYALGRVDTLINSGLYDKGLDSTEKPYEFSSTEMAVIRERSKKAIMKVFELLPEKELKLVKDWKAELADHPLSAEYAELVRERVDEVLFSSTPTLIKGEVTLEDKTTVEVNLPVFKFKHSARKLATELLKREGAPSVDWLFVEREAVKSRFRTILDTAFNKKFEQAKAQGMSREVLRWYLENREIYEALGMQADYAKEEARKAKERAAQQQKGGNP